MNGRIASVVATAVILLASCSSTPSVPPVPYQFSVMSEKDSGLMDFDVNWGWQNAGLFVHGTGFTGFTVTFVNKTDKIARVVWEQSSVGYSGQSYPPFIGGQKYIEASRPMAATLVPAKSSIVKQVFSSGQPFFESGRYGGWRMSAIPADNVSMIFCVQSSGIEDFYTIKITQAE